MVVKQYQTNDYYLDEFESSVISYGSKAGDKRVVKESKFESSVISYGSKAVAVPDCVLFWFESSVISYGSKANHTY